MADCEQLQCSPEPLINRLRASLVKLESGCLAIRMRHEIGEIQCAPLTCNDDQSGFMNLERATYSNYILASAFNTNLPLYNCSSPKNIEELIARMLGKKEDGCFLIFTSLPMETVSCDQSCDDMTPVMEKLFRAIGKPGESDCNYFFVALSEESFEDLTCDDLQEGDETLLNRLLEPLTGPLEGKYAIRYVEFTINPRERCFSWQWVTSDPTNEVLESINAQSQTLTINTPFWDAGHLIIPVGNIIQEIKDALDNAGIGYSDVSLDTVSTQDSTTFTFTISHLTEIIFTAQIDGETIQIESEVCDG